MNEETAKNNNWSNYECEMRNATIPNGIRRSPRIKMLNDLQIYAHWSVKLNMS